MSTVLVSTRGQIALPAAIRKALGLRPGTGVDILKYSGPRVTVKDMRVTDYRD